MQPGPRNEHSVFTGYAIAFVVIVISVILVGSGILASFGAAGLPGLPAARPYRVFGCSSPVYAQVPDGFLLEQVPAYAGEPSVELNGNVPYFETDDYAGKSFETYSELDALGRCGMAFALVGPETMPTATRGSIGMIRPTGWQIAEYDWVDGRYLYNRCHLIAFALASENDNPLNLITGTRSMNVEGMLPYEERVASYIDRTGNHVLYRVTPVFEGNNLVASGVLIEAESVEDDGAGICFCVWCYNVEPGVTIDYATGDNWASNPDGEGTHTQSVVDAETGASTGAEASTGAGDADAAQKPAPTEAASGPDQAQGYILNVRSMRFHRPDCPSVLDMSEKNKRAFDGTRDEAIAQGYKPCGVCNP